MTSHKIIKSRTEYYIDITDEERELAGWDNHQKFEWHIQDDGSVLLKPWVKVDIGDISELPREVLEMFVQESLDRDLPVNEIINEMLKSACDDILVKKSSQGSLDPNFTNNDIGLPGGQQ